MLKGDKRPDTLEQACGRILTRHREKRGLSQMDVAVATGYSLRYVGDLERGAKSATLRTLNDLATLFDVSLGSIISEAERLLNNKNKQIRIAANTKGKTDKERPS